MELSKVSPPDSRNAIWGPFDGNLWIKKLESEEPKVSWGKKQSGARRRKFLGEPLGGGSIKKPNSLMALWPGLA